MIVPRQLHNSNSQVMIPFFQFGRILLLNGVSSKQTYQNEGQDSLSTVVIYMALNWQIW